ncbi:MAG: hypothetical protein ABI893_00265 [Polaromonas sp.]|uniref:hypothetical protein n=1 Tax=Polaromonas sp. TaxID=1869339 RepID=UPI0032653159
MTQEFCFFHPRDPDKGPVRSTLNKRSLKIIVDAIGSAWSEIDSFPYRKSKPFKPADYFDEDELTTKLAEILNDKLTNNSISRFRKENFQTVVRDGKQSTSSLNSSEQMPDLTFRMIQCAPGEDREESALFVEAKLVSETTGCRQYVVSGLFRFVSGKYAPQVTFGMMLGYSTTKFKDPDLHLHSYYASASSEEALLCASKVVLGGIAKDCFESTHSRQTPCAPEFKALHLWLPRPVD